MKKTLIKFSFILLGLFLAFSFSNARKIETFTNIKNYKFYKEIIIPDTDSDYYFLELDQGIKENSSKNYSNIRIDRYVKGIDGFEFNQTAIPYYIFSRYGEESCSVKNIPYKKVYQLDTRLKGGKEILLDFESSFKAPSQIELVASEQGSKFRASYEVFGSDLKNSKYTKINTYDRKYGRDFDVIDLYKERDFIKISQKYRYIKIIFKLDEGKIGDLKFTKTVDSCNVVGGDFEIIKPKIISEVKNENNREIILDVDGENLEIDKIIFKNNNEKFSQRKISIFASNNKNATDHSGNKRYDENKDYWKSVARTNIYDSNNISDWEISLNNSNYRYYKVTISGGEKKIDFDIEFKFYKDFLVFRGSDFKKGERLELFYGNDKYGRIEYNDLKKEIENLRFINDGEKYNDIVSNSIELKVGPKKENNKFQKVKKLTKTETNILIYLAVFLVLAFLGGYLWKVFRDVEEHKK